jgi:hypothetical protein
MFLGEDRGEMVRGGLAWTDVSDGERGGLGGGSILERIVLPGTAEGILVRRVLGTGMPDLRRRSGDVARDICFALLMRRVSLLWTVKKKMSDHKNGKWELRAICGGFCYDSGKRPVHRFVILQVKFE